MRVTSISLEDYLWKKMSKINRIQTDVKPYELIDHFAELHNNECWNEMKMEAKDKGLITIQLSKHMEAKYTEATRQISYSTKHKR